MNKNKSKGQQLNELRRSNASGTMLDRRTKRLRDRRSQKQHAIKESRES